MKKLLISLVFAIPIWVSFSPIAAQNTLHLIYSVDNTNEDIKEGCAKDRSKVETFFNDMASYSGLEFESHPLVFNQNEVYSFFKNFHCEPTDVAIFLYSGHGFRHEDDQVIWPFMYYCNFDAQQSAGGSLNDCGVPLEWIHEMLISKGPRMSVTLGNSCNNIPGDEAADKRAQGLRRHEPQNNPGTQLQNTGLLTQFQGHIIASGASPGEYSYTNDETGSYFVNALIDVMYDGMVYTEKPTSWASMLKKAKEEVNEKKTDQHPQFLIVQGKKKMYSEGEEVYNQYKSYNDLNLEDIPDIEGSEEYDDWEMEDFDEDDYMNEWEDEYESGDQLESALENLPYILFEALLKDDGDLSQEETDHVVNFYVPLMEDNFNYDQETARWMLDFALEDLRDDTDLFNDFLKDALEEFQNYLEPEDREAIIEQLINMADSPDAPAFTEFLDSIR